MRASGSALKATWLAGEVAVIGLARSGRSVSTLLARAGCSVYASDAGDSPELRDTASALLGDGVQVEVGGHDLRRIARAALAVVSPGVPPTAPPIAIAVANGVEVASEVEIALRFLRDIPYIAVTGTNGKTTTTALVGHIFRTLGLEAATAGNIGTPLSEIALSATPPEWIALELSSFQLHDTPSIAPTVGVLTNLSANHLDRYARVEDYFGDKALLFRNATASSHWVSNSDDAAVRDLVCTVPGRHRRFSVLARGDAFYDGARSVAGKGGQLVLLGETIVARSELQLLGNHNVANALAAALAVAVADPAHRTPEALRAIGTGLRTFRGLEHRIELVGTIDGVTWVNDSKSTNVTSTLVALRGMDRPTILLLGGRHKGEPYASLTREVSRTVKLVIAYGEAAPLIEADLAGAVPMTRLGTSFREVIRAARLAAANGDCVLLSPACSSYDMFDNYEARGTEFKRLAFGGSEC